MFNYFRVVGNGNGWRAVFWCGLGVTLCSMTSCVNAAQQVSKSPSEFRNLGSQIIDPLKILEGYKVVVERSRVTNGSSGKKIERIAEISVRSLNQWRVDLDFPDHGMKGVFARTGSLAFSSVTNAEGSHRYTNVGYDRATQKEIEEGFISNSTLAGASRIMDLSLPEFLAESGLEFVAITPIESTADSSAEKATWNWPSDGISPNRSVELIWLPENGYLLEGMIFRILRETENGLEPGSEFSSRVEFQRTEDGSLVPYKVTSIEPGLTEYFELKILGDAEQDPAFYRPEAVGLKSPPNPYRTGLLWLLVGVGFAVIGITFIIRQLRSRR